MRRAVFAPQLIYSDNEDLQAGLPLVALQDIHHLVLPDPVREDVRIARLSIYMESDPAYTTRIVVA